MKLSIYKSYDDLPLFLNARTVANVLGVSISSAYELMLVVAKSAPLHPANMPGIRCAPLLLLSPWECETFPWGPLCDFPTLKVGSRLAVPRDAFRQWAERKAGGAK